MVFINEKKFACATCIKGHRVSGCTHTERPLFEIKKKGRPTTQCACCKSKRKGNSVHNKCVCGDDEAVPAESAGESSRASGATTPIESIETYETRKGQPGSSATFPNGLRDVHEINAAVEALTGFAEDPMRSVERSVAHLLNPCNCKHTGICKCCAPKRPAKKDLHVSTSSIHSRSSGSRTPDGLEHTEKLVELLKSKSKTSSQSGSISPHTLSNGSSVMHQPSARHAIFQQSAVPDMSPSNPHHPPHTSKHVHKTKLYSPYSHSPSSRHNTNKRESLSRQGAISPRPHVPPLRPLADMSTFLGALFRPDGTVATEISRKALGLPGIHSFDEVADQGGVKSEPMEWEETIAQIANSEDVDMPLAFPTMEDAHIGACTCGEDCRCAGCLTHPHGNERTGDRSGGGSGGCTDSGCKSCFDCTDHLHIPAGVTSIEHLLAIAASNVPQPARTRPKGLSGMDTSISPPSAGYSPESAAKSGFVQLKPLECCNGRCQCRPGECVCEKDCCGCCVRCACGEDAPTPKADTSHEATTSGGCCSASKSVEPTVEKGSCCETGKATPRLSLSTLAPPATQTSGSTLTPPHLSPSSAGGFTFNPSAYYPPINPSPASASGSSHHSPLLSPYQPTDMPQYSSSQSSPSLPPSYFLTAFDQMQLPSASSDSDMGFPTVPIPQQEASAGYDDTPLLRRSASISNGHLHHAHTQSMSAGLGGRRATVTAASGVTVQRSASTGKQASKALALQQQPHHPHVRPSGLKASTGTHSTLLVPPKAGSSSSRGTSVGGRRRSGSSAHHSRAPSPGASNHGSVDLSDPTSTYMRIPSLPIVTTSAPDETRQQVSFDPTSMPGLDDPDLTALLQQLAAETGDTSDHGRQSKTGQSNIQNEGMADTLNFNMPDQPQAGLTDFNIPGRTPQEEMFRLLAQSMSGQPVNAVVPSQSQPGGPTFTPDEVPFDFEQFLSQATSSGFNFGDQTQSQPGEGSGMAGWVPGLPNLQPPAYLGPSDVISSQAGSSHGATYPATSGSHTPASTNPDIIDLSKPLNADHLERIIKALQLQQARSPSPNPSPVGPNPPPNPTQISMPPPPLPPINRHTSEAFRQVPAPDTIHHFDPSVLGNQKKHTPSFSISSFDSFLAPPPSDSSGSGSGHSTLFSGETGGLFSGEGEDVFDRYIMDNSGEGLDLSALDLGNVGAGGAEGEKGESGSMELGLELDDWVWDQEAGQ